MGGSEGESLLRWASDGKLLSLFSRNPQGVFIQSLTVSPYSCFFLETQVPGTKRENRSLDSSLNSKHGQKVRGFTQMPHRKDLRGTRAGQTSRVWMLLKASVATKHFCSCNWLSGLTLAKCWALCLGIWLNWQSTCLVAQSLGSLTQHQRKLSLVAHTCEL